MGKRMKGEERKKGKEPESIIILDFGVEEKWKVKENTRESLLREREIPKLSRDDWCY